jgi:hypothetical protein
MSKTMTKTKPAAQDTATASQTSQETQTGPEAVPTTPIAPDATGAPQTDAQDTKQAAGMSLDQITNAKQALWDQAIAIDQSVEAHITNAAWAIGRLILDSFNLERHLSKPGPETRNAFEGCMADFGTRYRLKTKREPQAARWVNAYLAYTMASDDSRRLIEGSESAPFATDTLVALAEDAHATSKGSRRGMVACDRDAMTWHLDPATAKQYDALVREILEEGYTAKQTRERIVEIKRAATAETRRESQAEKEAREQAEKTARIQKRSREKTKAVETLQSVAQDLKIGKAEMMSTLHGAGLIDKPRGYDPNTMDTSDAKQFAMELVARTDAIGLQCMAIIADAIHRAMSAEPSQVTKRATATVNDTPKAPKPGSAPIIPAASTAA